jgi:hypothetical protein
MEYEQENDHEIVLFKAVSTVFDAYKDEVGL